LENAKFVISLDFELFWGVFDTLGHDYNKNLLGTREAIRQMLDLFQKYEMHVTWATVGLLFNESKRDFENFRPKTLPTYKDKKLNPYNVNVKYDSHTSMYMAHDMIKLILSYPNQEIGSHSYSHYYCKEDYQTIEQFESDIKSAVTIAKEKFHLELKSYIFAKNEINLEYLPILKKYGFTHYRGNPKHYLYKDGQQSSKLQRALRLVDSYINIGGHQGSSTELQSNMTNIIGDRFLRPYSNKLLNRLMLYRIKSEMKYCAKNDLTYHLWWHPHNFGVNMKENINSLEKILIYYHTLKDNYGITSYCMKEI